VFYIGFKPIFMPLGDLRTTTEKFRTLTEIFRTLTGIFRISKI